VSSLGWSGCLGGEQSGVIREGNGVGDTHTQRGRQSGRAGYSIVLHYPFPSFPHSLHAYRTNHPSRFHLSQQLGDLLVTRARGPRPCRS